MEIKSNNFNLTYIKNVMNLLGILQPDKHIIILIYYS
jgi:hypothetical protein